ncbi:3-oxoadipyl-CoA thiolase [Microbulbifer pacificus]|uniref:Beta-ketoadipyl-CoA thiolase n=1 Tax=Microbulbifer pacificus TaxID=407164 RepID=A0AAU0N3Y7_9GAMM|nr:3-oxoadipyl-CoA thiolase [Microbulbifer pacificus]WOX07217.1 3-oxoadipyl-CoA thiolase [Microbulbifer pacificus]
MKQALICDGIRTPIGRYAGALASVRADDLGAIPLRALIERNPRVDWEALDEVFYGCANQAGEDNRNVARMAALLAGLPVASAAVTVNRLCGSGMEAVGQAARAIFCGEAQLAIAGGVESMSRAPLVMPKADTAFSRQAEIFDTTIGWRFINPQMQRMFGTDSMPETAENVAERYGISREDQDRFALRSQQKCAIAQAEKLFDEELVAVPVARGKGEPLLVARDEHPRADTRLESLAALRAPFRDGGSVTAGNASGVNDGACALLLASEDAARQFGLTPRARVVGMASAGVEPRLMGMGPVPAVRKLLRQLSLSLEALDVIELNEAFAAQALAVLRELGLRDDDPRVNPNGGAIALGHPLGMSGARLINTAVAELHRRRGRYALCTMCVGVGQGIAVVIERI